MVRHGFVNTAATLKTVDRTTETFDVRKAKRDPEAASLSGGNLQKFVVGREILREPRLLVVSQPTWGVDAGAAAAIRQAIIDLAARGAAVLVMSQDLDELYEISDRLVVICGERLSWRWAISETLTSLREPSWRAASLIGLPSSSQRRMGTRYLSGKRLNSSSNTVASAKVDEVIKTDVARTN
jgi:ABC-type uncharacterized transport system ATPase subunit